VRYSNVVWTLTCHDRSPHDLNYYFTLDFGLAIGLQIMELIADKKGIDKTIFESIQSDLDGMKRKMYEDVSHSNSRATSSSNSASTRPPSGDDRESKKQRI
jgi:hypothetical protein